MITLTQKEQFLKKLAEGSNIKDALKFAKIPKASLYRFMDEFPAFKKMVDETIEKSAENLEKSHMEYLKKLIQKK